MDDDRGCGMTFDFKWVQVDGEMVTDWIGEITVNRTPTTFVMIINKPEGEHKSRRSFLVNLFGDDEAMLSEGSGFDNVDEIKRWLQACAITHFIRIEQGWPKHED